MRTRTIARPLEPCARPEGVCGDGAAEQESGARRSGVAGHSGKRDSAAEKPNQKVSPYRRALKSLAAGTTRRKVGARPPKRKAVRAALMRANFDQIDLMIAPFEIALIKCVHEA